MRFVIFFKNLSWWWRVLFILDGFYVALGLIDGILRNSWGDVFYIGLSGLLIFPIYYVISGFRKKKIMLSLL